jgi:hypothetical protein
MSGHKPFRELIQDFSPERIERINHKKQSLAQSELSELEIAATSDWKIDLSSAPIDCVEVSIDSWLNTD